MSLTAGTIADQKKASVELACGFRYSDIGRGFHSWGGVIGQLSPDLGS
jgi:hypothetical protein